MPQHRQIPFLSLTLLLVLQGKVASGLRSPVFVGESGAGTRYYFEPLTEDGSFYAKRLDRHTVDGFYCEHVRHSLGPRRASGVVQMAAYTVDAEEGSKQYWTRANIDRNFSFEAFIPLRRGWQGQPLLRGDPVLSTAESLWTDNQLLLADAEEPAPNGVYYGFNEDGVEATLRFDRTSQLTGVKLDPSNQGRYNEFIYAMVGKAIRGSFYKNRNSYDAAHLLLEPVDRKKFDGSRESFSSARLDTVKGWPFPIQSLPDLLITESKLKAVSSRIVRRLSPLRNHLSKFRRHGKDGLKRRLVEQDDAGKRAPDDDTSHMVTDTIEESPILQ
ncbi:hypothetical protein FOZ63_001942 [Perkinsus olseni]|uniref:Uncharacterized protein n=1 Tax=Perkinsus olseni TaxID=32597 RepID=A0A7J6Q885_PEROL|nr:hypothetical protein FOZ63_001942 [Perkinsus olseni]KAF4719957.1 hypothetical protein FOZ62_032176 [Perkinsus olseni]